MAADHVSKPGSEFMVQPLPPSPKFFGIVQLKFHPSAPGPFHIWKDSLPLYICIPPASPLQPTPPPGPHPTDIPSGIVEPVGLE